MASQFENAGLGMFGSEKRFIPQGKESTLRFLAGALLSPKVALPSRDTGPSIAVPDAAVPDAAVPDAAVPDAAVPDAAVPDAATQAKPIDPVSTITESAAPAEDKTESDEHPDMPAVMQDLGFEPITTPIKQSTPVSEKLSGISPDAFKPDRSQDAAILQALYTPNPNAAQSVGQSGVGGGQIATSILSKLFTELV